MSRSGYWRDVASVAETTRTDCESFDPETGDATTCIETGIAPIVSLYVRVRQQGEELSPVERSLLEGALTDWLAAFAACHDVPFGGGFTVREVALAWTENGTLDATIRELVGVENRDGSHGDGSSGRA